LRYLLYHFSVMLQPTGDTVQVKKKRVVAFKAGKALEDAAQVRTKNLKRK